MSTVPPAIADAYDPERFRADGHRVIDVIADALARWQRRDGVVLPWRPPADAQAAWASEPFGGGELADDLRRILAASTALAHPHCMAHQVPPPLPGAALAELVSAVINNGMAVYEMGPASVPIELAVIDWMCGKLGYPAGSGGVLTSGGSLGNLTALLAMRQTRANHGARQRDGRGGDSTGSAGGEGAASPLAWDVWKQGAHGGPPLAVIVSEDAHYSLARTLRIMGWGDDGAVVVLGRMTGEAVERVLRGAATERRVIGIVAAAGSTATGAFDPLDELADVAARHDLWLHVDAAHGGGACLSAAHRGKLRGIERADSVVWDAHKLLMMPALVTAVLFKRGDDAYQAFAQQASYLFSEGSATWDLGHKTLECTKRAMAIEVWTALRVHGEAWFGEVVDRQFALARELAAKVAAAPDFELGVEPEANIVCYRHRPDGVSGAELDAHNRALRQRVVEDGRFYIVGTELRAGYFLRSTIMNPLIEPSDFDALLAHLRSLCPR